LVQKIVVNFIQKNLMTYNLVLFILPLFLCWLKITIHLPGTEMELHGSARGVCGPAEGPNDDRRREPFFDGQNVPRRLQIPPQGHRFPHRGFL
jgi:hypothetical protein